MRREGLTPNGYRLRLVMSTVSMVWTFLVLGMGVLVVATDSGQACGFDWPYCQGSLFPNIHDIQQVIEYTHRLLTGLLGFVILGNALFIFIWRQRPVRLRHLRFLAVLSVVLLLTQALVGGFNVLLKTPKGFTTLDVMVSSLLWMTVVALWAKLFVHRSRFLSYASPVPNVLAGDIDQGRETQSDASLWSPSKLGSVFLILLFGDLLLGAFFKHSALAEVLFGLHPERVWLTSIPLGETVYVVHGLWGISLWLVAMAWRVKSHRSVHQVLHVLLIVLVMEAIVGMGAVVSDLGVWDVALHTLLATLTLGLSVVAYVFEQTMKGVRA